MRFGESIERARIGRSSPGGVELVFMRARLACVLVASVICAAAAWAQQSAPPAETGAGGMHLDVVVTAKPGTTPIGDLEAQDFTVLDNKIPQNITSFKAVTARDAPIEVVLVIDAVNTNAVTVNSERVQIDRFLRADEGNLAYPVALDVVNDKGIENAVNFSSDGNWISAALHERGVGIRDLGPAGGYWGATERLQISLKALSQIVERDGSLPGRKIVLWVSPGWPLLNEVNTGLNAAQRQQLFESIVGISTDLRRARITLYSIDPLGAGESTLRTSYYENFLKGVSKPSQVDPGDVGLQVIAVQSGGLALNSGNDITMFLQECVADAAPYYEISFAAPAAQRPDEYHQVEIKIDKPGLSARAREGYYAQPSTVPGN